MNTKKIVIAGAAVGGIILTAVFGSVIIDEDKGKVVGTWVSPSPSTSSSVPDTKLEVGQEGFIDGGSAAVKKVRYTKGYVSIDIRVCNMGDMATDVSPGPWSLSDGEGVWDVIVSPSEVLPSYAFDPEPLEPQTCMRGWLSFEVSEDSKPRFINYDTTAGSVSWKF